VSVRHILVAVDGAEASREALEQAVWLTRQGSAALTGLFVIDTGWADFIGNDWQSSACARRGFLDYVDQEQQAQAEAARAQFEAATHGLADVRWSVFAGHPVAVLLDRLNQPSTDLLIFGRRTFQVSGRPSLKRAAYTLARQGHGSLLLLP
jgi:nucleotide-binding universal stress UspA family protein